MLIEVISPHGFCGGVERAVKMAREALAAKRPDAPVFCLHEIVHNEAVAAELGAMGMMFVESVEEAPHGATLLISAHGAPPAAYEAARVRALNVIDATCPFVAANHRRIRENFANGMRTAVVGEPSHAEVRGYLGEPGACRPEDLAEGEIAGTVVQTTLDSDGHDGVCTATHDRQEAVRRFIARHLGGAQDAVGVLVAGSANSANTARLVSIAQKAGARAWLAGSPEDALRIDLSGIGILGVTSGASTPEPLFLSIVASLRG